eukprot:5218324-Pleurochrysis_carterae.AAC.1
MEVPDVPTVVIGQEDMEPWARGTVWDCGDPRNCTPLKRSTRDAAYPGKRHLDRAALRKLAEELRWHDTTDIVAQAGEGGGLEPRVDSELITVLAFHHPGLLAQAWAAAAAVDADLREGWAAPPVRHLPFMPCRVQPRDVNVQARQRVVTGAGRRGLHEAARDNESPLSRPRRRHRGGPRSGAGGDTPLRAGAGAGRCDRRLRFSQGGRLGGEESGGLRRGRRIGVQ